MKGKWLVVACSAFAISASAWAGEAEWLAHMQAGSSAYGMGDYAGTEKSFRAALIEAEAAFSSHHANLALSLNNLAELYRTQGRHAEAEPLFKRSLAIYEKGHGGKHASLLYPLRKLATLYRATHRYADARKQAERALAISRARYGTRHAEVAADHSTLAQIARAEGRYTEAERHFKRSISIHQALLDREGPGGSGGTSLADALLDGVLNDLAELYLRQGLLPEAELVLKRSLSTLKSRQAMKRDEYSEEMRGLNNLALLYSRQNRLSDLAAIEVSFGSSHLERARSLHATGLDYLGQSYMEGAESLFLRCLVLRERMLGPDHPDVAECLHALALLYRAQGRDAEAEPLYRRSLAILESAHGVEHRDVATSLNNLAVLYQDQGRIAEAEPLFKRSLSIREKVLDGEHPSLAASLNNLAALYIRRGRYAEAEPLYVRSLAIYEKSLAGEDPDLGTILNNLGHLNYLQERYPEAEPYFLRSLAIRARALGASHPSVAESLGNLAVLYRAQYRFGEAEVRLKESLAIQEAVLGAAHPDVARSLGNMATLLAMQRDNAAALSLVRRATRIFVTGLSLQDDALRRGLRARQRVLAEHFERHVGLLVSAGTPEAVAAESFEVAQWARASDTAEQVAKMAARHAAGSDALAKVARERQDLRARLEKLEADLLAEVSKPADKRNPERDRNLRQSEAETKNRLRALDERITREFPRYGELTRPKPLSIAEAQKLLGADEALLLWLVGDKESYLWAVRRDRAAFHKLDMPRAELDAAVRSLRLYLDLGASSDPEQLFARPFDAVRAHALYAKLLGPAEGLLKGAKHLILVPDGPLQGLPPAVLVTEAPKAPVDHREAAWLVRKYALTVLPSANSLRALRAFAARKPGTDPLIGFGDPVLEGRGADGGTRNRGSRVPAGLVSRGAVADPKKVRQMDPLPNTADELKRIAASLKAPAGALHLGAQATETRVKQVDLTRARVLAFATHGLMAEEFQGMAEPALVLTPPAQASAQDDGLLTASEISQLRLNADWVVLSACNTAASDGRPGAEGLSGLSRAFFYAGARALMVSHWAVETNSAAALTTGAFAQKGLAKAEALRQSMLALMGRKDLPHADHPALWAPFVVVGEGGRR